MPRCVCKFTTPILILWKHSSKPVRTDENRKRTDRDQPCQEHLDYIEAFQFIWKQGGAIIRSYVLYQPLRTFLSIGGLLFLIGAILLGRFGLLLLP